MKLVLFSDLHLDAPFVWAGPKAAQRRRQALRDALVRVAELTKQTGADALLCAGDLFEHDYFTPDTAMFVKQLLEELDPIRVFCAPGNHDWYSKQSLYHHLPGRNIHVFTTATLEPVALAEGVTLWGAAHCVPANTDGFLDRFRVSKPGINLALFHGSERNFFKDQGETKQPYAPFSEAQIETAGLHHAFVGHFHKPKDARLYTYAGCLEPLAFGDPPGDAVIVTVSADGRIERERHSIASGHVRDMEFDLTPVRSRQDLLERLRVELKGVTGIARVTLVGELQPDVDLNLDGLEDALADHVATTALTLRFGPITTGYSLDALAREQTVRGQFINSVRAANLSPHEERRILITGLRALEGRSDLEAP